ncbi:ribosomal protection-like ABC-F family protein [Fonticella tunisiensis]|uniref:ATP-binding cassette subfamily F protein 3 n=1 Tax=Fonticella tunisiensis TaxID=1096341 RepID=A0A4V3ERX2_9CLOT|nr:ABC-F type ribosomal protection protein [Fonticella tunisiensis]TDT50285.1 ATP-binding cassette subfamily F protein 3 [Fonticella tunisiensis]
MIVLSLNSVSKSYGVNTILKDINFAINEFDKIGLVGRNGAGKTTLFKILCGQLMPDSGNIYIQRDKTLGYLSQNLDLDEEAEVFVETMKVFSHVKDIERRLREIEVLISNPNASSSEHERLLKEYGNLQEEFERLDGYGCESYARGVLIGLGITSKDFTKKIKYLSGGQKTRVALAKLLLRKPDILLLDEPTNHLDLSAIYFLENFLKDYRGTVILISHDRYFLDVITNKTFELLNGVIEEYNGNYSYFIKERQRRFEERMKDYELQQKEIKRLEEMIERFRSYNREKSIKQAESREKALDRIERIDRPTVDNRSARINFDIKIKSGNDVLVVENLSKAYGEKVLFTDLSFMIRREERVALIGENGRGKSTILKIVSGLVSPDSGYVRLGKNVQVGYYDQEQRNLSPEKTVIDEIWDEYPDMTVTQVRNYLASFLFTGDDVFKTVSTLSGGEKCRLSLLKVMLSKPNFLLLDEPTNHLDILSREALENALLNYMGTLLVVSHDRYFLNKIIHRIIELDENGLTEYLGNFQYYLLKKNSNEDEIVINAQGKSKTEIREERRRQREIQERKKQLKKDIEDTEKDIQRIEERVKELEELMCLEEVYSNPEKSIEINSEVKHLRERLEELYEKWEELLSREG